MKNTITIEKAAEIAVKEIKKTFPDTKGFDGYLYFRFGEVGDWWVFHECGPNNETAFGGQSIFVSKDTGEAGSYCWPNKCHPAEREHKYVPLNDGKPLKIHV